MGALYSGRCYSSAADAASAMFSGTPPALSGGVLTVIEHDGGWFVRSYDQGVLVSSSPAPQVDFYSCSPVESVADGAALGFSVALVWASAWVFHAMRQAIR